MRYHQGTFDPVTTDAQRHAIADAYVAAFPSYWAHEGRVYCTWQSRALARDWAEFGTWLFERGMCYLRAGRPVVTRKARLFEARKAAERAQAA